MHTTCQLHQLSHLFELNVKCHVTYNLIGRVIWVDSFNVHEWLVLNYLALSVVDFDDQTPLKFGLKLSIIWERNIRPRGTWLGKVVMETMLVYCKDKSSYPSIVVERVKSRGILLLLSVCKIPPLYYSPYCSFIVMCWPFDHVLA